MRCLRELPYICRSPRTGKIIKRILTFGSLITGNSTLKYISSNFKKRLKLLIRGMTIPVKEMESNGSRVIQHLAEKGVADNLLSSFIIDKEEACKTLGLFWNAASDCKLQYQVDVSKQRGNSKRDVLSKMQICDALGLVGPNSLVVFISGKLIIQQPWKWEIGWNQELLLHFKMTTIYFYHVLNSIN